ncbi:hypothetical protein, partial [Dermatophilus congolensis]
FKRRHNSATPTTGVSAPGASPPGGNNYVTVSDIMMGSMTGWSYHQAGHLIAAALRGATPTTTLHIRDYIDRNAVDPAAAPFLAFAGPWSERECGAADVEIIQGKDAFDPAHASAQCADADIIDDANHKVVDLLRRGGIDETRSWGWVPGVTAAWRGELREAWPVIRWAATALLNENTLSVAQVQTRLREEGIPHKG